MNLRKYAAGLAATDDDSRSIGLRDHNAQSFNRICFNREHRSLHGFAPASITPMPVDTAMKALAWNNADGTSWLLGKMPTACG
jgi:hypothetical protein